MDTDSFSSNQPAEEYRCQPMVRVPLGAEVELLYFPLKKTAHVVNQAEARLLAACRQFATLSTHTERIAGGDGFSIHGCANRSWAAAGCWPSD